MWHPEPFVKHPIPATDPPTADEAARSLWFSPLRSGRLELSERTWVPAMVPWRATEDGLVTPEVLAWYERFARGQPGALVVEATGIRDIPSGPLLRIGHDRFIPGLAELVRTVRRASGGRTRLFIQIIDFLRIRRRPEPERFFREFLRITDRHRALLPGADEAVREALAGLPETEWPRFLSERELESLRFGERERVTDTDLPHIRELPRVLPDLFAGAAARAEQAGFDGVELHYAHAYTMASFLSALNHRDDGYGGSRANRVRLPLEVYQAVRAAVSDRFVVGCRFLGEECIPGGGTVEDAAWFSAEFARAGMGAIRKRRDDAVRAGRDGLPLALARGQVRGRQAAARGLGPIPLHRTERLRVHADGALGRARPLRAESGGHARRAGSGARRGLPDAGRPVGRHLHLRAG
jgi:2,4-dienoyl-CoA reductase-like NADH-dependent reductase (Old Yellow Enzyme family)